MVHQYIQDEVAAGRFVGPLAAEALPNAHVSRMGVIPKGRTPGHWRLITDLSWPSGNSVNDGIAGSLCSLEYTSVDRVAQAAQALGQGALLVKADVKAAYRLVPVHPDDRELLAVEWKGERFLDARLPFGLRSAPIIFTAVADAIEWCVRQRGVSGIDHYLDDYIIVSPPCMETSERALRTLQEECAALGVPLAPEKQEGPTTRLRFLGIDIATATGQLLLPADKLTELRQVVDYWLLLKVCRRRELESLVGSLHHASKVIRPGRTFLRRMIDLLKGRRNPHHYIRLNREFKADLTWWQRFAERWNGVAFFAPPTIKPYLELTSDASGNWGCGACMVDSMQWWQVEWLVRDTNRNITYKELFAVVVAAAVWGRQWRGRRVRAHCDNQAVVHILASRTSKDPHSMHLLRCLFYIEAEHPFTLTAKHIAGVDNEIDDHLFRNKLNLFFSKLPQAPPLPTPVSRQLTAALLDTSATWTSPSWTRQFITTVC